MEEPKAELGRLIAILTCALAVACGGARPPGSASAPPLGTSPSASPSVTPPAAWETHRSVRFGYTIRLPAGWTYEPATADWPADDYPNSFDPFIDNFSRPPDSFPTIDIVTQVVPEGRTHETYLAWLDRENARICSVEETERIEVDGETGRFQRQNCGYNAWEVAVFDGDRVYLIYWLGRQANRASDEPLFREILATFRFAPA